MRRVPWRRLAEGIGLALALTFVFLVAYIPHFDLFREPHEDRDALPELARAGAGFVDGNLTGYPYPLHVDEHIHWVYITNVQRNDQIVMGDAYRDPAPERPAFFSLRGAVHERGFHLILAQVQEITGVPFLYLFQFLPAAWMAFTAFCVYALMRPSPVAIPAAAFVGLIPTTVRFMGPSFLVPIGFSLAWIPVALILAEPARCRASAALLLLVVVAWAFFVHLIGGFATVGFLALGGVFAVARDRKTALLLILVALAPVLWLYRAFAEDVQAELEREEGLPIDFTIFDGFGIPALLLWGAGLAMMALRPPKRQREPILALSIGSMIVLGLILGTVAFEWGKYATYARWHPPFFLTASVPIGYAIVRIGDVVGQGAQWLAKRARAPFGVRPAFAVSTGLLLAALVASPGVAGHLREPYYQVINDRDWATFTWVAANVGPEYEVFLTHPWKAPILTALTGKEPRAVLYPGAPPVNGAEYDNYVQTGGTLDYFILHDVTLVVTTGKPPLDEFVPLGPGVWGLRADIAHAIAEIRAQERGGPWQATDGGW